MVNTTGNPDAISMLPDSVWTKVACEFAPEADTVNASYFASVEVMPGIALDVSLGRYQWDSPDLTGNTIVSDGQFAYQFYGPGKDRGLVQGDSYLWRYKVKPEFLRQRTGKVIRVDFFKQEEVSWPSRVDVWFVKEARIRKDTYNSLGSAYISASQNYYSWDSPYDWYNDSAVAKYTMPNATLSLTTNWAGLDLAASGATQSVNELRTKLSLDPITEVAT